VVSGEAGTCDSIGSRTIRCENAAEVRLELGDYGDQATILSNRTVKVHAGTGDDTVTADDSTGDFTVYGNAGNDTVKTGDGEDHLSGGDGNDHLVAGDGKDTVRGNAGDDQVWGGHGDDQVEGHSGNDKAYGGPGNDNVKPWVAGGGPDGNRDSYADVALVR
jgi:Ca2+-binding RTX toxin-like protein